MDQLTRKSELKLFCETSGESGCLADLTIQRLKYQPRKPWYVRVCHRMVHEVISKVDNYKAVPFKPGKPVENSDDDSSEMESLLQEEKNNKVSGEFGWQQEKPWYVRVWHRMVNKSPSKAVPSKDAPHQVVQYKVCTPVENPNDDCPEMESLLQEGKNNEALDEFGCLADLRTPQRLSANESVVTLWG